MGIAVAAGLVISGVAITAASSLTSAPPTANPTPTVPVASAVASAGSLGNASCTQAKQSIRAFDVDTSRVYSDGIVTIGDWQVNFRSSGYQAAHRSNPALTQTYYSFGWLVPDSSEAVPQAIDLFVDQSTVNADVGGKIDRKKLPDVGWSESAVTLRLKTALCLYRAAQTQEERDKLMPAIDALLAANMDEARYYGPPRVKPHNHGVMADRELLNAAEVLDRPDLATFAKKRLKTQLDGMYDACGFTYEQSNGYQHFHASLWRQVARRVANDPAFQNIILNQVEKLENAAYAVTFPDGFTPRIGDGAVKSTDDLTLVAKDLRMSCPTTGWFSWRKATGQVQQQVIARYGPGTNYHGHADKGAVVWWAKPSSNAEGVEVLADRGLPGKNRDDRYAYAVGPTAHATLLWPGGSNLRLSGKTTTTSKATILRMDGSNVAGGMWNRTVTMNPAKPVLKVVDKVGGKSANRPVTQNFPLDPVWLKTSRVGTYRTADGLTLTIQCSDGTGKKAAMRQAAAVDYQLDEPRSALTVTCTVPRGGAGATATLTVSGK